MELAIYPKVERVGGVMPNAHVRGFGTTTSALNTNFSLYCIRSDLGLPSGQDRIKE